MGRQSRLARNRVLSGLADFLRNLGLLFVAAPLVEPLARLGPPTDMVAAGISVVTGLALVFVSLIFEYARKE
ncbi:MAG: hypothetical protein FD124_3165 [Alphaproteobacteria bacterium]|nr:MAG: hypothetical protein FD160_3750 [Caulobacteraceae bacterium]TPW03036.1 MAG: hypothetical protein FD124_3165 [Alphaproteobacteria bacterium]